MNSEPKQLWLAALRSGNFPQAQGRLKTTSGYCCLGVLCEISGLGHWTAINGGDHDPDFKLDGTDSWEETMPPDEVQQWAGISHATADKLATMNDDGAPFKEIATYIEQNL